MNCYNNIFKLLISKIIMVEKILLIEPEDFFKDAQYTTELADAHRKYIEEETEKCFPFPAGYHSRLRQAQNWSILGQQIVGGEV